MLLVTWIWMPMAQARVLERLLAAAGLEGQTLDAQTAWRPRTPFGSGLWGHTPAGTVRKRVAGASKQAAPLSSAQ